MTIAVNLDKYLPIIVICGAGGLNFRLFRAQA
jgi:hypothetical protein